jgi:DNA polymerase-4
VKREIGTTISIGVSWNKVFAKLGSDYKKPDAVTVTIKGARLKTINKQTTLRG